MRKGGRKGGRGGKGEREGEREEGVGREKGVVDGRG